MNPDRLAFVRFDRRRTALFLGLAFGIAWVSALVIALTGGLVNSPVLVPQYGITLAYLLLSLGYMWAPALAHILTRVLTEQGWRGAGLRPHFRRGWRYYLAAWFLPPLMAILGALVYFLLFSVHFSTALLDNMRAQGIASPWLAVIGQALLTMLFVPLVNGPFAFGEEFGWRAYLLPRLMPLGERKAMLAMGLIWGVWYWPAILMGQNYGLNYPGAPWAGLLATVWMTLVIGVFLSWITLRSGSIWPAVAARGAINGFSGLPMLFLAQTPYMTLGPTLTGILGNTGFTILAVYLLMRTKRFAPRVGVDAPERAARL